MTKEEFIYKYCMEHKDNLIKARQVVSIACKCGEKDCNGWEFADIDVYAESLKKYEEFMIQEGMWDD